MKPRQGLKDTRVLVHFMSQYGELSKDALGARPVLDDVFVAALLQVAQLGNALHQACLVARLKDVLERVQRLLCRTDRRHRVQVNGLDRHLDGRLRQLV